MNKDINTLIVELQKKLELEYGDDFQNFYLVNSRHNKWEGIIASEENKRKSVEYYTIEDKKIVKEEKTIY